MCSGRSIIYISVMPRQSPLREASYAVLRQPKCRSDLSEWLCNMHAIAHV